MFIFVRRFQAVDAAALALEAHGLWYVVALEAGPRHLHDQRVSNPSYPDAKLLIKSSNSYSTPCEIAKSVSEGIQFLIKSPCRERVLYSQPTDPNPLTHRDEFSRPALRHGV